MIDIRSSGHQNPGHELTEVAQQDQRRPGIVRFGKRRQGSIPPHMPLDPHGQTDHNADQSAPPDRRIAQRHDGAFVALGLEAVGGIPHGLADDRPLIPGGIEIVIHAAARLAVIAQHTAYLTVGEVGAHGSLDHLLGRHAHAVVSKVWDIGKIVY